MAALWQPGIVGWSGIPDSQESKLCLNLSWWSDAISLRPLGQILKSAAPLTAREPSLAFLTLDGVSCTMVFGMADHPLLRLWLNSILYPLGKASKTKQKNLIGISNWRGGGLPRGHFPIRKK